MSCALLDDMRYGILWPTDAPLLISGEEVVVDVYSGGALYLLREVRAILAACDPYLSCRMYYMDCEHVLSGKQADTALGAA